MWKNKISENYYEMSILILKAAFDYEGASFVFTDSFLS